MKRARYKIALAGNPNSGKTTLFNLLTGSNQYVGNWPGVTVEKKSGVLNRGLRNRACGFAGYIFAFPLYYGRAGEQELHNG